MTDGWVDGPTIGWHLDEALGGDYFAIGTVGGNGTSGGWIRHVETVTPVRPLAH